MGQIVVLGQLEIHPDDAEAVAELMRVAMNESAKEQGCHHYAFSRDLATPNRFQLSELWEDDASLAAHALTPHIATYRAALGKLRIQSRTVTRFEASNPKSL